MSRRRNMSIAANPILIGGVTVLMVIVAVYLSYNANHGLPFVPTYKVDVVVPNADGLIAGNEVRIGRHSTSSGIDPEIDLSVPPADPGVSRLHAVLLRSPDGSWSVVDPGSANGTEVNGSEIPQGQPVPLRDGDRIHLGAWTELRVVRGSQPQ